MALGADATTVHIDAATDNPQSARAELKTNWDSYNTTKNALGNIVEADAGDGIAVNTGSLDVDLATNGGLEISTAKLTAKVGAGLQLLSTGIEPDILGLTTDATPDLANDWIMTEDVSTGLLKKVHPDDISSAPGTGSITQTEIANAAVGQGELKTTTGDVSVTASNQILATGPGGEYGFWPTIKNDSAGAVQQHVAPAVSIDAETVFTVGTFTYGTTLINRFVLGSGTSAGAVTARQRYVQASPPYNLGDGEVAGFIFTLMDNTTGEPIGMYQAPEPPWANNGPTNIRPDLIDKNGKKFKLVEQGKESLSDILGNEVKKAELLALRRGRAKGQLIAQEITHTLKNADMGLIPHPFLGNDMTGKTIVLLDPMSGFVESIMEFQQKGEDTLENIFHKGFARIDNIKLSRKGPSGVDIVSAKLK